MLSKTESNISVIGDEKIPESRKKSFLAEGNKLVNDLLGHFSCKLLIATAQWLEAHPLLLAQETIEVSAEELAMPVCWKLARSAGCIRTTFLYLWWFFASHSLCLALDDARPGNLGTIIRIADWFGIHHIFCSYRVLPTPLTPKPLQATMGARLVQATLLRFEAFIRVQDRKTCSNLRYFPWTGKNMLRNWCPNGIIVMGNEGKRGQSASGENPNRRLLIPNPQGKRPPANHST